MLRASPRRSAPRLADVVHQKPTPRPEPRPVPPGRFEGGRPRNPASWPPFRRSPLSLVDLTFTVSPVVLAVSAVAAGALAWWSYGRSTPAVSGARRVGLAALRFAALFLVLLLLVDPVWRRITRTGEPPLLAVLIDDSESLRLGPDGTTPATEWSCLRRFHQLSDAARAAATTYCCTFAAAAAVATAVLPGWLAAASAACLGSGAVL